QTPTTNATFRMRPPDGLTFFRNVDAENNSDSARMSPDLTNQIFFVTLTRWNLFFWQRAPARECHQGDSVALVTARHVWLRLCRAVTFVCFVTDPSLWPSRLTVLTR